MYWLRWHYHVKDIAGAPYKIKKKRETNKTIESPTVSSRGHTTVILCDRLVVYCLPAITVILFYWIRMKVVQQLTGLTLGRPKGPKLWNELPSHLKYCNSTKSSPISSKYIYVHRLLIKHFWYGIFIIHYNTARLNWFFCFFMCPILFFFNTVFLCLCFYAFVFHFVLYW